MSKIKFYNNKIQLELLKKGYTIIDMFNGDQIEMFKINLSELINSKLNQLIFGNLQNEKYIQKYRIFFNKYNYISKPKGYKSLGFIENKNIPLTPNELEHKLKQHEERNS